MFLAATYGAIFGYTLEHWNELNGIDIGVKVCSLMISATILVFVIRITVDWCAKKILESRKINYDNETKKKIKKHIVNGIKWILKILIFLSCSILLVVFALKAIPSVLTDANDQKIVIISLVTGVVTGAVILLLQMLFLQENNVEKNN